MLGECITRVEVIPPQAWLALARPFPEAERPPQENTYDELDDDPSVDDGVARLLDINTCEGVVYVDRPNVMGHGGSFRVAWLKGAWTQLETETLWSLVKTLQGNVTPQRLTRVIQVFTPGHVVPLVTPEDLQRVVQQGLTPEVARLWHPPAVMDGAATLVCQRGDLHTLEEVCFSAESGLTIRSLGPAPGWSIWEM